MTLSVCMIVRDEVHQLAEILKQCQSFADEIIVVDTGSVDNTKEVAKRFTDKVFDFSWGDDFSAARNYAISKATNDYILIVDADDRIDGANQGLICQLKEHFNSKKAFQFLTVCHNIDGKISIFPQVRCFPNRKDIYYQGRVHEEVLTSLRNAKIETKHANIRIQHIGYMDEKTFFAKKARNLILLKKAIKDKPSDAKINFHLGQLSEEAQDYPAADKYYRKALPYMESIADGRPLILYELLSGLIRVSHELNDITAVKEHFDKLCVYSKGLPPENTIGICMLAEKVGIYDRMYAGYSHSC